jgi:hypothetical protein
MVDNVIEICYQCDTVLCTMFQTSKFSLNELFGAFPYWEEIVYWVFVMAFVQRSNHLLLKSFCASP